VAKVGNSLFDVQALWAAFNCYSHSPGPAPFRRQSPRLRDLSAFLPTHRRRLKTFLFSVRFVILMIIIIAVATIILSV